MLINFVLILQKYCQAKFCLKLVDFFTQIVRHIQPLLISRRAAGWTSLPLTNKNLLRYYCIGLLRPVIAVAALVSFEMFNKRLLYCIVLYRIVLYCIVKDKCHDT